MPNSIINATRPYLPPLEEFLPYLEEIWRTRVLTNSGPLHQQLERELEIYFADGEVSLFSNGTVALVTALQALNLTGEVITTPYSFVATSHALLWLGLTPVFVDIDPHTLNIDPSRIEAAITNKTSAILGVHCYGTPCDVKAIKGIAERHGLKVIYDAAHAFGVRAGGQSLLAHGDLSVLSFHATKVFNTFEGGAVVSHDTTLKAHIDSLRNFGKRGELEVVALGTNGKMSEVNAALGLVQLGHVEAVITLRANVDAAYRERLEGVRGITLLGNDARADLNYSYFPIFVGDDYPISRNELDQRLRSRGISARPYFYPLISDFPMYRPLPSANPDNLPVASEAARKVLCLPMYPELSVQDVDAICNVINS